MMNDSTYTYVRNLVITNIDKAKYYICYSNTNSSSSNVYDVYCAFGDDLKLQGYKYSNASKFCSMDMNSYYNSGQLERIICNSSQTSATIRNYETIYTNLDSNFPNLIADYQYNLNHNIAYNIDTTYTFTVLLFLLLPVIIGLMHHFFRID